MSRRSDQLSRMEQAAARLEEAVSSLSVLFSQHSAATRTKLDGLDSTVSGLTQAVQDVMAARALRDAPPQSTAPDQDIPPAGDQLPPQVPAPAAGGGTIGEGTAARRAPRTPKTKQEKP